MQPSAVTASILTRNESESKYRESEREYSFQSWPKSSCDPARVTWWTTKYDSKKRWTNPAGEQVPFDIRQYWFLYPRTVEIHTQTHPHER